MNETEGLLADAQPQSDDNQEQAEEQSISHLQPDTEPSLDDVTLATEQEDIAFERPDWYPDKFWDESDGPDLENLVKSYNELQKKFSQGQHKVPDEYDQSIFTEIDLDKIKAKLTNLSQSNNRKNYQWKPQPGKQQVRIVPYKHQPDNPMRCRSVSLSCKGKINHLIRLPIISSLRTDRCNPVYLHCRVTYMRSSSIGQSIFIESVLMHLSSNRLYNLTEQFLYEQK